MWALCPADGFEIQHCQHLSRPDDRVTSSHAVETRRKPHMFLAGEHRVYSAVSGHVPNTAPREGGVGNGIVTKQVEPPTIGPVRVANKRIKAAFTGPCRSDQTEEFPLGNAKGQPAERGMLRAASLTQAVREDRGRRRVVGLTVERRRE